jgi:membrane-associated phospholipid phosphatase
LTLVGALVSRKTAVALVAVVAAAAMGGALLVWGQVRRDAATLVTADRTFTRDRLALAAGLVAVAAAEDSRLVALGREKLPLWIEGFKRWGTGKTANVVGARMVAGGVALGERRVAIGGLTLIEGNLLLGTIVDTTKNEFGRIRPNHPGAGAWYAGGDSFPSSHTAHAFLIASVLDATLGKPECRWVVYAVATGVGLQRIHEGVHYPTDVMAGAMVGWWVGNRLSVAHGLVEETRGDRGPGTPASP